MHPHVAEELLRLRREDLQRMAATAHWRLNVPPQRRSQQRLFHSLLARVELGWRTVSRSRVRRARLHADK
jgi:hypothetical protein